MAMTSSKMNVDTINPFKDSFGKTENKNRIRDLIISAFELSARTKVPILFFSNPGFGKTTTIYNIAKMKGMHVESLCGSQYSQDEILGFQTNETGSKNLIIKEPEWYSRIMDYSAKKTPSILFLDEMSTVSGPTQGAMLQLVFERCIRGGKYLPDDCVVVAAANYKGNLPGYSEIIAPNINRFCVINILPENAKEAIDEFTQGISETQESWPNFENFEVDDKIANNIISKTRKALTTMFGVYNNAKSNKGLLDIRNTMYDGIYDRDDGNPEVLNFISGRSMSNLMKCFIGLASMGMDSKSDIYKKAVDGLIGLGTNTWTSTGDPEEATARLERYLKDIHGRFASILDDAISALNRFSKKDEVNEKISQLDKLMGKDTVSNKITAFVANHDDEKYATTEWTGLFKKIYQTYGFDKYADNLKAAVADKNHALLFRSDMDCLETLLADLDSTNNYTGGLKPYIIELQKIYNSMKFYYNALGTVVLEG